MQRYRIVEEIKNGKSRYFVQYRTWLFFWSYSGDAFHNMYTFKSPERAIDHIKGLEEQRKKKKQNSKRQWKYHKVRL